MDEFKEASEFSDEDENLTALYAPLRSVNTNPKDFQNKLISWSKIIELHCEKHQSYSFDLPSLEHTFERFGRPPACLHHVVNDMLKTGKIILKEDFLQAPTKTWREWSAHVAVKGFEVLRQIVSSNSSQKIYVCYSVIQKQSKEIFDTISGCNRNKVVTLQTLAQELNWQRSKIEDLKLLLHYLQSNGKVAMKIHNDQCLVKVGNHSNQNSCTITDTDLTIFLLEQQEQELLAKIDNIEGEMTSLREKAKDALQRNRKEVARMNIRKKHELQKRIQKECSLLENLQSLLTNIQEAGQNSEILATYKQALTAFNIQIASSCSEDDVDETVQKLSEALEIHNDIQINLSTSITNDVNDSDLEKELADLVASSEKETSSTPDIDRLTNNAAKLTIGERSKIKNSTVETALSPEEMF